MQRARRSNQPAVPRSIDEAEASLINTPHYKYVINDQNILIG